MKRTDEAQNRIDRLFDEVTPIEEALRRGAIEALREHRRNGTSIVVMRDDEIVELRGEEIDRELERIERGAVSAEETGPR